MKKIALVLAVAGILGFSSCNRCYQCETIVSTVEYCTDEYNSTQLDALEKTCEGLGGKWKAKL